MTVTVASFREELKAFADPSVYDSDDINFYINLGVAFQNPDRWDPLTIDHGTCLFVAHNLVLDARANAAARASGIPGTVQGVQNSKSVDKVAVGYDVNSVIAEGAAWWNMTTYGIRFIQLTRAYGAGGAQVNGCPGGGFSFGSGF
jgi:hypothetical protein